MLNKELIPLEWNNQRIMTTEMLTECFKTGKKNIHVNFKRNKDRFIEGKHYYLLKGRELGIFKNFVNVVDKRTPSLMLWTFDGCLVHADLLENSRNFIDKMFEYFDCDKVYVKQTKRKELEFIDKLKTALTPFGLEGITQYSILGYRIDFYISSLNIAIEYDENNHKHYSYEAQEYRQQEIEKKLGCRFIRISDKNSDEYNIGLVIKEIFNL